MKKILTIILIIGCLLTLSPANLFSSDNNFDVDIGNVWSYTYMYQTGFDGSWWTNTCINLLNPSLSLRGIGGDEDSLIRFGGGINVTLLLFGYSLGIDMTGNLALFASLSSPWRVYTLDIGYDFVCGGIYINNTFQLSNNVILGIPFSYGIGGIGKSVSQGINNNNVKTFSMSSFGFLCGYRF